MKELLEQSIGRLRKGEALVWCVILQARGSTPRDAGTLMAVFADGSICGTVGGGKLEQQAIALAREPGLSPVRRSFDLDQGRSRKDGMVCGGSVSLGFLPFSPGALPEMEAALEALSKPGDRWLELRAFPEGSAGLSVLEVPGIHENRPRPDSSPRFQPGEDGAWRMTLPLSRDYRVYIFGAGHVSAALAPLLLRLDFPVTVYDPRPELAAPQRFSGAQVLCGDFEEIAQRLRLGPRDYAVVMTPEHAMDFTVLRQLLTTEARYIGCIGSRRKTAYVNQLLTEAGFSQSDIQRIHAPIGLPIGARTPEEIAVSIAAQLIQNRAGA